MAMAKAVSRMGIVINLAAVRNSITHLAGYNSICTCHKTSEAAVTINDFDYSEKDLEAEESLKALFKRWQRHYDQGLDWDPKMKAERFKVFKDNAKLVHELNKRDHECTFGLNEFAAMTNDEFQGYTGRHGDFSHREG